MNPRVTRITNAMRHRCELRWAACVLALSAGAVASALKADDVVSREVSVRNTTSAPPTIGDVVSREVSVRNAYLQPPTVVDVVSRECSVRNDFRCLGDINADGVTDLADAPRFINVLLLVESHPYFLEACDMNCDGRTDGQDIQTFVDIILDP